MKEKLDRVGVYCPHCGAYSYPYSLFPDVIDEVYCKACNRSIKPKAAALDQFIKDVISFARGHDDDK